MNSWNINTEELLKIPGNLWIYWKNKEGVYLGCNDRMANNLKLSSRKDICGRKDIDLPLIKSEEIDYFSQCDQQVYSSRCIQQFHDTATLSDLKLEFLALKSPIFDQNNKITGIIGFSYLINKTISEVDLNERAIQMLHLLVRGKTAKEIARHFNLSYRTVEHYLVNIRKKFNVSSKAALINKAIDYLF